MDYFKAIVFQARTREDDPAVASMRGVASYGVLLRTVSAALEALTLAGVEAGRPVVLDVRDPLHHVALFTALGLLGVASGSVGTPLVVQSTGIAPQLYLTDRDDVDLAALGFRSIRVDGRWFASVEEAPIDYPKLLSCPGFASPDDIVRYVFSSGTTGTPKCIGLTHRVLEQRMISTLMGVAWWTGTGAGGISLLGFSTIAGTLLPIMFLTSGRTMCFAANNREVLQLLNLFSVSLLTLSVGQLQQLLAEMGNEPPPVSLRLLTVAGARLPIPLLREARAKLCTNVWVSYGSTEMGNMSSGTSTVLETEEGCAGYVWPWIDVQTVDPENNVLAVGVEGVIRVRSPEAAFYINPDGTRDDTLSEGWFYTGDVGRMNNDGLLVITGRATEVINRGGVVVAPEYIEEALKTQPGITDAAVFAAPNSAGVDEIWAGVVTDQPFDEKALIDNLRGRLADKVPNRIVQVSVIPRGETGKLQRTALRDAILANYTSDR